MSALDRNRTRRASRPIRGLAAMALALVPLACGEDEGEGDDVMCGDAKCDDLGPIGEQLATFNDPIAVWLRANIDKNGEIDVGYLPMLEAIAKQQGCTKESIDSYVISDALVGDSGTAFPRVVNTVCSTDRTKADLAFFALSFADDAGVDVDPRQIEMFAWDATTFSYRFYKGDPVDGSATKVSIQPEPSECQECHLQPDHFGGQPMPMTPIMNELSAPWEHWFAEPQSFNHSVPDATKNAPHFKELAGEGSPFRKSAARLEQTIRSAFTQRVATARLRLRRNVANVDEAMALLRPLFCDEQLTYVTEDGASGVLSANAAVDEGLASVYFAIKGTGWPWEWWQDKLLRLSPPGAPDMITMMPSRGAATIAYEKQLMSVRGLTPEQVMRVRALDWATPTLSSFRCQLWQNALPRVKAAPPTGAKNSDIFTPLFDAILTLQKGDFGIGGTDLPAKIPLSSNDATKVVSIAVANEANVQALADAIANQGLAAAKCEADGAGFCLADANALGAMIETRFKEIEAAGRTTLTPLRTLRACAAKRDYPNAPAIENLDCDSVPEETGAEDSGDEETGGEETGTEETGGEETDGTTGETGTDVGDCCTVHDGTGCSNDTIEACVCAMDDVCCTQGWDDVCVDEVASFGCGTC